MTSHMLTRHVVMRPVQSPEPTQCSSWSNIWLSPLRHHYWWGFIRWNIKALVVEGAQLYVNELQQYVEAVQYLIVLLLLISFCPAAFFSRAWKFQIHKRVHPVLRFAQPRLFIGVVLCTSLTAQLTLTHLSISMLLNDKLTSETVKFNDWVQQGETLTPASIHQLKPDAGGSAGRFFTAVWQTCSSKKKDFLMTT